MLFTYVCVSVYLCVFSVNIVPHFISAFCNMQMWIFLSLFEVDVTAQQVCVFGVLVSSSTSAFLSFF